MQVLAQARKNCPNVKVASNSAVGDTTTGVKAKGASTSAVGDGTAGVKAKVASPSAVGGGDTGVIAPENIGTMYLCFAELFPGHETIINPETFRGLIRIAATNSKRW